MSTPTTQRRTGSAHRGWQKSGTQSQYNGYRQGHTATARAYEYPGVYPEHKTRSAAPARSPQHPTKQPRKTLQSKPVPRQKGRAKVTVRRRDRANLVRIFLRIGGVFLLCCLMIYRYAMILEANNQIAKLNAECAAISAANQAIQAKIDRGLELGTLEEYATTQIGMIRPDNSQIFYIDMQLGDGAQIDQTEDDGEKNHMLQGTPGALVHAIQVLK